MQTKGKRAFGQLGEEKASAYLESRGHRILARNWRGSHLEVDIISEASDGLHFVEVKTRLDADAAPEEKVDARKQARISAAALKYLKESGSDREVFFDVISVTFAGDEMQVKFFPQAWIPMYK
jgi:putative endonuclease